MVATADKCIKNLVWNSYFAETERAASGWVKGVLAEQALVDGGIGVPNLTVELAAMSAMAMGEWALTTKPRSQAVGQMLHRSPTAKGESPQPRSGAPVLAIKGDLWATGKPWVEYMLLDTAVDEEEQMAMREVRRCLRTRSGCTSRWSREGLQVRSAGKSWIAIVNQVRQRRTRRGDFLHEGVGTVPVHSLLLWSETGVEKKWRDYKSLVTERATSGDRVSTVTAISRSAAGAVTFTPVGWQLPMEGRRAALFTDFCMNLLANYPEICCRRKEENLLRIHHPLSDQHHIFTICTDPAVRISHTWGSATQSLQLDRNDQSVEEVVAKVLAVPVRSVWMPQHNWSSKLQSLG